MIVTDGRLYDPVLLGYLHLLYHIKCKWLYSPSRKSDCLYCGAFNRPNAIRPSVAQ